MWHLLLKNKQKNHNYAVLKCKYASKKTTDQLIDKSVTGDQRVKK